MSASIKRRLDRIERLHAPEIPADQCDPMLIGFLSKFGIPAEKCPRGITAMDWLTEAFKGARVLGVAKPVIQGLAQLAPP